MASATPNINCFHGQPYMGNDGQWHCVGDSVPPANEVQIRRMNLPTFVKMQMVNGTPSVKVDPTPTTQTLPVPVVHKNCLRHQSPPNFTYVYNPKNGNCILVALADAPALQQQLNQAAGVSGNGTADGGAAGDSDAVNQIKGFIAENPFLTLIGLAGVAYFIGGRGMKPKSREVVSTTKF